MKGGPESIPLGTVVGDRYRLDRLIGTGGFGAVFAASDATGRQRVALKVIDPNVLEAAGGEERVHREAELARRLVHPNTVRVIDSGRDRSGALYIAFELLEGRSIESALQDEGPMSPFRACAIAIEILGALEEAHQKGIIHRDIKPGNIFLVNPGVGGIGGTVNENAPDRIKVLDFGIAKSTSPQSHAALTREGTSVGTPAYMAPEQMLGQAIGPHSDLYSVGLVLAEMILGESPYGELTGLPLVMERVTQKPVPFPADLVASPLGPLLKRATAEVSYRFTSASEMRDALAGVASSLSIRTAARRKRSSAFTDAATAAVNLPDGDVRASAPGKSASPFASSFNLDSALLGSTLPDDRAPNDGPRASADSPPRRAPNKLAATTPDSPSGTLNILGETARDTHRKARSPLAATQDLQGGVQSHGAIFLSKKNPALERTVMQSDAPAAVVAAAPMTRSPQTLQRQANDKRGIIVVIVVVAGLVVVATLAVAFYVLRQRGIF